MFSLIPWNKVSAVLGIALLVTLGAFRFTYVLQHAELVKVRADVQVAQAKAEKAAAELKTAQGIVTVKTVTEYVDRVQIVREKGETIVKEVKVYVTPEADAACVVPVGFVRVHDAAASGEPAVPAGDPDAPAEGIALSTVAETIAENYTIAHENAEQLTALQKWAADMERLSSQK